MSSAWRQREELSTGSTAADKNVGARPQSGGMTTSIEPFNTDEDRARVLGEILRQGGATRGRTLIGYVDRASLEVLAVQSLATPDAVLDDESCFSHGDVRRLSHALCAIARSCAPDRVFSGSEWSPITGDLITVVCRGGDPAITPTETQFHWGWRFSNHLTSAFDSEVYAITPQGWASLYGQSAGRIPALPVVPDPDASRSTIEQAERVLVELSSALFSPRPGECVLCYVYRMVAEFGCDCRLRFATHYRDLRAPRATGLERRLGQSGGYCDCEIFLNGYEPRPPYSVPVVNDDIAENESLLTWPDSMPRCAGVRAGSTQPCSLWGRQDRSW